MAPDEKRPCDDWETPWWLMRIFAEWDDPCPIGGTGGLEREWKRDIYCNPPYSDPTPWIKRAIAHAEAGNRVVLLLKHDSSTEWWRLLHETGAHFLPIIGRIRFDDGKGRAPFPSVLVILEAAGRRA